MKTNLTENNKILENSNIDAKSLISIANWYKKRTIIAFKAKTNKKIVVYLWNKRKNIDLQK